MSDRSEIETYILAEGAAFIRELRWMLLFVRSEPAHLPPDFDEDTGESRPVPNTRAGNHVRRLAARVTQHPGARELLAPYGWNEDCAYGEWEAMLARLPPCPQEQTAPCPPLVKPG